MNYGVPIDNDFLRTLKEYKGKPDSELTVKNHSKVALRQKDMYASEAIKCLDELKSDYRNGIRWANPVFSSKWLIMLIVMHHGVVSMLCHFYNASGCSDLLHCGEQQYLHWMAKPLEHGLWPNLPYKVLGQGSLVECWFWKLCATLIRQQSGQLVY